MNHSEKGERGRGGERERESASERDSERERERERDIERDPDDGAIELRSAAMHFVFEIGCWERVGSDYSSH